MAFTTFSHSPDCNVIFYPYNKEITYDQSTGKVLVKPTSPDAIAVTPVIAKQDIIECSTSKAKGGTGTFSILLSSNKNYKALLEPGAWCIIHISDQQLDGSEKNEPDKGFKMLGMVKSVRRKEVTNPSNGTRIVRYLVSGEDFQALLNTPIYLNAQLSQQIGESGTTSFAYSDLQLTLNLKQALSPDELIKTLIENLLGVTGFEADSATAFTKNPLLAAGRFGVPMKVPPPVSQFILGQAVQNNAFTAFLTTFFTSGLPGLSVFSNTVSGSIPVWSLLDSYKSRVLNELYTEMIPVLIDNQLRCVPSIVFRPIPYNSKGIKTQKGINTNAVLVTLDASGETGSAQYARRVRNAAISHGNKLAPRAHFYVSRKLRDAEIIGLDTGKSDKELTNFILFTPNTGSQVDPTVEASLINSISTGDITLIADIASIGRHGQRCFTEHSNYIYVNSETAAANKILRDMWMNAHVYESGQVIVIGDRNYIPVGTNLEFLDRGWVGHIEQVDHRFITDEGSGTKSFRTTLTFVRLQNSDGTPIDPVDHSTFQKGQVDLWDRGTSSTKL